MKHVSLAVLFCLLGVEAVLGDSYDPRQFGAIASDGVSDTASIQQAIDQCSQSGGGDVFFQDGTYIAGTLLLKTGVTLRLGRGATLECANDPEEFHRGVWIHAAGAKNVGIIGPGTIDGKGSRCFRIRFGNVLDWLKDGARNGAVKHPVEVEGRLYVHMIQFSSCAHVELKDLRLKDSQHWTVHVLGCSDVEIRGVHVRNVPYGPYTDGIDIDSSSNVTVVDCDVTAGDDAFCVKTTGKRNVRSPAKNIVFERCVARSPTNGFKIGTETRFDISDVTFRDCKVEPALPGIGPIGGLTITSVDGAHVTNIFASDIEIQLARCPVFVRLGNRGRGQTSNPPQPGSISAITIQNVTVRACMMPVIVSGIENAPVKNLSLRHLTIKRLGDGSRRQPESVPELASSYPEATMFGAVPGRVLFCRHTSGVRLEHVSAQAGGMRGVKEIALAHCKDFEGMVDVPRSTVGPAPNRNRP